MAGPPSAAEVVVFLTHMFIFGHAGSSLLLSGFLQLQQDGATLGWGALASCRAWALGARASLGVCGCGVWV